ncbi:MAG: hypothetical protein LUG18_09455 [Candidatus Azobacteroides sp.]|nr:hypothetical protein [Candidatus Azobacteroides sp.]
MIGYFSGTLSEKDQLRLFDLIAFNEELKSKFDEMARTRAILHIPAIESEKEANYKKIWEQMEEKTTSSRNDFRLWFSTIGKIAAVFIFLVTVSFALFYIYKDGTAPAGNRMVYETFSPAGSQTKILLPDSTLV